jgi:uncharacterized repeat protein (TIGR02543 family)
MKKRIFFLTLVACLSIILLTCSLNDIKVANAAPAYIFSDGFESHNLNAWTAFSGTLSINTQTVNSGVYSVESIQAGQTLGNLYYQVLGGSLPNPIDFREYVYINSTTVPSTSGDYYEVGGFASSTGGNYGDGEICVFNIAQTLYWGVYYRNANSSTGFDFSISTSNSTSDVTPVSIGWNCVELKHTTGTITTYGEEQLYLNGVSILDVSADNYERTPANVVIGGSQTVANPTDSWNYYIDDVAVYGSYIGPLQYQLTMSTNYGTVTPPSGLYNENQTVPISATPPTAAQGERYIWQGWVGSGVGNYTGPNNSATVTMGSNITEQAVWEHDYYLTVSSAYGAASGSGWYDAGSSAYAAVSPTTVAGTTGIQYIFTGWSGGASGTTSPSNAINMNGPKTATANWQTQYYLTVSSAHGTPGGADWYNSSSSAYASTPLVVAGATGTQYVFTGWSGGASGTTSPSNAINMNGPKTATANWQTQYYLTFAQSGVGSDFSGTVMTVNGTVYGSAGFSAWANPGDVYTFSYASPLVVTANGEQYLLTGVSGNNTASILTVSAATTITGAYKTQYYLTATSTYGSPSPSSGWLDSGSSITEFVGTPVPGASGTQYACSGWSGTGSIPASGTASAVTFTISAASNIAWNWQTQYLVSFAINPSGTGTTSPSGTNVWENAGANSIFTTTTYTGYTFSSWSSNTSSITFGDAEEASATATISGPGTITANLASVPTPTPAVTPTPTNSPSPSPSPTLSPSPSPTTGPSSSPTKSPSTVNNNALYLSGLVVAIVIVAVVIAVVLTIRKRNQKK